MDDVILKYKELIAEQKVEGCPPSKCIQNASVNAVRWVIDPLENELNFLPNHLYNSKRNVPPRVMDDNMKCGYCSVSFHETISASKDAFNHIPVKTRQKLGYTHLAEGTIVEKSGLITPVHPITKHFELFEVQECNFLLSFKIVEPLEA